MPATCNWPLVMPDKPSWWYKPWLHATVIFVLTVLCYVPGLDSPFLFDDQPNLAALSHIQDTGISNAGFWEFVFSGNAGPTGRPVSLFSFALQANAWPDAPATMKAVNLLLHVMSALLLYVVFSRLAQCLNASRAQAGLIALFAALAWALHPLHTSTVLYAVQRMALLANFFMLLGIAAFVEFRCRPFTDKPANLLILTVILGCVGLLGLYSKENGASLVFYLLVLDYTVLQALSRDRTYRIWRLVCLWLPATILLLSPLVFLDYLQTSYADNRSFTLVERLLTQGRVLWQYLAALFIPGTGRVGLFHDIAVSRSLVNPLTTLVALMAWAGLIAAVLLRPGKHRIWALALGWYLAGHVIESTVLPLELFFHHRSYLAIAGILFALSFSCFMYVPANFLRDNARPAVAGLYITLLLLSTVRISLLWASPLQLAERWYEAEPDTTRNAEFYAMQLTQYGRQGERLAATVLDRTASNNDDNFHLLLNLMTLSCVNPDVPAPAQARLLAQAGRNTPDSRDPVTPVQQIIDLFLQGNCPVYNEAFMRSLLEALIAGATGHDKGIFQFELARLNMAQGDQALAISQMGDAWENARDTGILFNQAVLLINAGRYEEALDTIALAEREVNENNDIKTGTREDKLASLASMREDVLGFMAN